MIIVSSAFKNNGIIPKKYTIDGANINPPFQIADVPKIAKSIVIALREEDSSGRGPFHWLLYNIDPQIKIIDDGKIPEGAMEGKNTFGKYGYTGPSSDDEGQTIGTHYYIFRAYALDDKINIQEGVLDTNQFSRQLIADIGCNVLDSASLVGFYKPE